MIEKKIDEITYDTITEQHIKEGISTCYVQAIAHYAGFNIEFSKYDYGFDGTFSGVKIKKFGEKKRISADGCKLDFQLKASTNIEIKNELVEYNLESKNYNDLVDTDICTPRILILYKLPKNQIFDQMSLRKLMEKVKRGELV